MSRRPSKHARELGAKKVMALPVSGAFHTSFMAAARDRLRDAIAAADIRDAEIPVVSNVDAKPHDRGAEWTALLSAQLASPVRWKQCLQTLAALGVTEFAELGPGGVLTGMAKRSVVGARTISVATPEDLDKLLEWVGGDTAAVMHPEGEHLFAVERLVVSPSAGIFTPIAIESGVADRRRHAARPRRRARGPVAVPRGAAELHRRRHRTGNAPSTHRVAAFRLTRPRFTSPGG